MKSTGKRQGNSFGWPNVLKDAEVELKAAEARVDRLSGIVAVIRRMIEQGQPYPISDKTGLKLKS
ncbi:hypothetical protein D3C83_270210 [compost metagenome]